MIAEGISVYYEGDQREGVVLYLDPKAATLDKVSSTFSDQKNLSEIRVSLDAGDGTMNETVLSGYVLMAALSQQKNFPQYPGRLLTGVQLAKRIEQEIQLDKSLAGRIREKIRCSPRVT